MNGHVGKWLEAYYDGELHGRQKAQVEKHLSECSLCQQELEKLRKLSTLLAEAPSPVAQLSAARFQSQVKLRLPKQPVLTAWERAIRYGWQAAPFGAIATWAFGQVVLVTTALILFTGLPGISLPEVQISSSSLYLPGISALFGDFDLIEGLLGSWGAGTLLLGSLEVLITAALAVFLWGWIASWWAYRRHEKNVRRYLVA